MFRNYYCSFTEINIVVTNVDVLKLLLQLPCTEIRTFVKMVVIDVTIVTLLVYV